MMIHSKICGITSAEDAEMVAKFSPDFLGIVCFEPSKRNVPLEKIDHIVHSTITPFLMVCVNPSLNFLQKRADFFTGFQFHGEESAEFLHEIRILFPEKILWKVLRPKSKDDLQHIQDFTMVDGILLDAFCETEYGGTGKNIHEEILKNAKQYMASKQQLWIAGGVNAQNVHEILQLSECYGVDLSSSLEISAGKKSAEKVKIFFELAKNEF